jgi:hypothetical protein
MSLFFDCDFESTRADAKRNSPSPAALRGVGTYCN